VPDPKGKTIATRDFDATVKCLRGDRWKAEGLTMTQRVARRPTLDKSEYLEMALRIMGGGLTIGLLIVLPALKILGWA
jgi:hypothetical protein